MYTKLNAKQQATASAASRRATVYTLEASLGPFGMKEIRCYVAGGPIFARAGDEYPSEYSHWEFQPAGGEEGVFMIKNVALGRFVVADNDTLTVAAAPGAAPAKFRVQPAGDGLVQIKEGTADRVWGLRGESAAYGEVVMQAADGSDSQMFSQIAVD